VSTAQQFRRAEQDTALRNVAADPATIGLAFTDHLLPFQCSIRVRVHARCGLGPDRPAGSDSRAGDATENRRGWGGGRFGTRCGRRRHGDQGRCLMINLIIK
jgi:hypothetical protein